MMSERTEWNVNFTHTQAEHREVLESKWLENWRKDRKINILLGGIADGQLMVHGIETHASII